jgi:hypothetical protein
VLIRVCTPIRKDDLRDFLTFSLKTKINFPTHLQQNSLLTKKLLPPMQHNRNVRISIVISRSCINVDWARGCAEAVLAPYKLEHVNEKHVLPGKIEDCHFQNSFLCVGIAVAKNSYRVCMHCTEPR